jgi:hypothetical protein
LEEEPEEYVDGTFSLTTTGGSYGPLQIGVRLKGQGSFRPLSGKAAFKLKFSHSVPGQRFLGLKGMTLNSMVQDPSMIHETLTYALHRALGVPAPRTGYSFVRVNGDAYGVYLNIEDVDEIMLRRHFATTRHVYEGSYGSDVTPERAGDFEVDEGSESDRGDLEALVDAAAPLDHGWSGQVGGALDLVEATRMWAVERYVGQWDSYSGESIRPEEPNNFFLHSDASGRFSMLPWGADIGWITRQPFDGPASGVLFQRCQLDEFCMAAYRVALAHLRDSLPAADLDGLATSTAAMLAPWQRMDPRREQTLDEIAAEVEAVRAFVAVRPADLESFLDGTAPPGQPQTLTPVAAPETSITDGPRARTRTRSVRFEFGSDLAAAGFECRLDSASFKPCASPRRLKVGVGRHRFRVRSVSPLGTPDATPAGRDFRVLPAS